MRKSLLLAIIAVVVGLSFMSPVAACDRAAVFPRARAVVGATFRFHPLLHRLQERRAPSAAPCLPAASPVPIPVPMPRAKVAGEIAPQSFETALREQISLRPEHSHAKHVLAVLNMEDSPRRTRIINQMEKHAATHLDLKGEVGKIDWSSIDWAKVFDMLIKLLTAILPFLLMASAETGIPLTDLVALVSAHLGLPLDMFFILSVPC